MIITGKFHNEHLICNSMERLYLYKNSTQINAQTGYQGYLRGDFEKNNTNLFHHRFSPARSSVDQEFADALQEVMEELHKGILESFDTMKAFCRGDGRASKFAGNWTAEYAFRIDNKDYAFLFRLIPAMGDYHIYCFCYRADWLDQHMKKAESGIRFIDPNYTELFRMEDGGKIFVKHPKISEAILGNVEKKVCRYCDDYHVEINGNLYHICELAEHYQQAGITVEPAEGKMEIPKR